MNEGWEYRERVKPEGAGMTVLGYLCRYQRHSDEGEWQQRIQLKQVLLDECEVCPDHVLEAGQSLVWRRPPWEEPEAPLDFALLHKDDDLLAVAKPSGLPTLPGGGFLTHTLLHLVRQRFTSASPLHRLGRGTSGIVLFSQSSRARAVLTGEWRTSRVEKIYRALVTGSPAADTFKIEFTIGPVPHALLGTVHGASPRGKPAESAVTVLQRRGSVSLVEVCIQTGRSHQIRIHLAAAGHPLAGDPLYAKGGIPIDGTRALPGDCGYLLHASRLRVNHPVSGDLIDVICHPPPALRVSQ